MAHFIHKELESDQFNVDHAIENLTYKSTDGKVGQPNFDPLILEHIFKSTIKDLNKINENTKKKIESLENECAKEKLECKEKILSLEELYKTSFDKLATLDKRICEVSTIMSEMGSQLENLNKPRRNLSEAQKVAKYFDKFMDGVDNSGVFVNDSKLEQAAEIIYKLHIVCSDLNEPKFEKAVRLVEDKYNDIERKLKTQFHTAFYADDKNSMKKYINILSNFRGYQDCIYEFIKNSQSAHFVGNKDIFDDILTLCRKNNTIINEVFTNNERIMEQFIKDVFLGKFENYLTDRTKDLKGTNLETYLDTLYHYYNKTKKIFRDIADLLKLSPESTFFTKLMNEVFQQHLKDYFSLEKTNLLTKHTNQLNEFYSKLGHTKRVFTKGLFGNIVSITQAKNNPNEKVDERFLSQDLTVTCIDDAKKSLNRIQLLVDSHHQPKCIEEIYDIAANTLCKEHFMYAIELHIQSIDATDSKQEPKLHLFKTIKQLNNLMYLYQTFLSTNLLQIVSGTINHSNIISKQQDLNYQIESKIDDSIDKYLSVYISNYVKNVLSSEQKPSDFKPDEHNMNFELSNTSNTQACSHASQLINHLIEDINECFDGKNLNSVLRELGLKFHRCLFDHLTQYQYSEIGALTLIKDLNQYRAISKNFNNTLLDKLYGTLYSLSNLLLVPASNLQDMCSGDSFNGLNKETIETFIKLRADYRSLRFNINRLPIKRS